MSYVLQIQIKKITVIENGKVDNIQGVNGLSVSLFYPKSGVHSVESVRTLRLKDKVPLEFQDKPFTDKLLFKQEIEGDTMLMVKLTAIERVSKFEKVISKLLGIAVVAAVGTITGVGAVITAVVKNVTTSVFENMEPKDKINLIGEGAMPITQETPEGDFIVHLSVPRDLTLTQTRFDGQNEIQTTITIKKGFTNAMVVFDLKKVK
jgi:DnaJ-class molecular chaperone